MGDIKNRRAVSPVIATVILVAVAITIAVAVSYWMGGISSQYTRFEKIELTSAYCTLETGATYWTGATDTDYWEISIDLRNTGTTEASIINAFVNAKAIVDYGVSGTNLADNMLAWEDDGSGESAVDFDADQKVTVVPGADTKIILRIKEVPEGDPTDYSFTSGTTVEGSLHTGAGNTYMKMVTLT